MLYVEPTGYDVLSMKEGNIYLFPSFLSMSYHSTKVNEVICYNSTKGGIICEDLYRTCIY